VAPALAAQVSGCARRLGPCGAYAGLEGELAAIASEQRAARAEGRAAPRVVFDILGAPSWAALPPHGCEAPGGPPSARPLQPAAIGAYQALIGGLLGLARREGVGPSWWSPWNEPNDPRFLSPQRASCSAGGQPLATSVYAQLARAMGAELKAAGGGEQMLLGEIGGYDSGSPHRLSVGQFVAALPEDVACLGGTWAVHAYTAQSRSASAPDAVALLGAALDARGGCAAVARIWVTESGAGAPKPGRARTGAPGEEQVACRALAAQVLRWEAEPRVGAIFQYTFRDDPAFPVGLASADLSRLAPVYGMWLAISRAQQAHSPLPSVEQACPVT
jgi:hypothetical protein